MAEILSFEDARLAHSMATDRAEAFDYLDRMTAFQAEMRHLSGLYGILGGVAAGPSAEVIDHPALRRA